MTEQRGFKQYVKPAVTAAPKIDKGQALPIDYHHRQVTDAPLPNPTEYIDGVEGSPSTDASMDEKRALDWGRRTFNAGVVVVEREPRGQRFYYVRSATTAKSLGLFDAELGEGVRLG